MKNSVGQGQDYCTPRKIRHLKMNFYETDTFVLFFEKKLFGKSKRIQKDVAVLKQEQEATKGENIGGDRRQ